MRQKIYSTLARIIWNHPGKVMLGSLLFTLMMLVASGRLALKTQFSDMMPQDIPQIQEFNKIIDNFSSTETIMIVVESDEKNLSAMKKAARDIVDRLQDVPQVIVQEGQNLSISKNVQTLFGDNIPGVKYDTLNLVRRIDYQLDREFFARHGMMMQKTKDLENFSSMFRALNLPEFLSNINKNFEKEFVEDSENLSSLDGEAQAIQGVEGIFDFVEAMGKYLKDTSSVDIKTVAEQLLLGPEYFISSDNTLLMVMVQPSVSSNDWDRLMVLGQYVEDELKVLRKDYPDLMFGASGIPVLGAQENEAIKKDFGWSSLIAIIIIFVVLVGSFASYKAPAYSILVLIMSLIWVSGVLAIVLHYLNLMSASFGIVLIGLGIDFAIHMVAGLKDARDSGETGEQSLVTMYNKVGNGVMTGAVTTATVFFGLSLTGFQALTEMGLAVGIGILICLAGAMTVLPAFLTFDHKISQNPWKITGIITLVFGWFPRLLNKFMRYRFLQYLGGIIQKTPGFITVIILAAISVWWCLKNYDSIGFEYDMLELEPEGLSSIITQNKILDKFELSPDFVMFTVDNLDSSRSKIKQFKKLGNRTNLIGRVDGVTEFIPESEEQLQNQSLIKEMQQALQAQPVTDKVSRENLDVITGEIARLHSNLVEMGEMSIMAKGENNKLIRKTDQITGVKDEDSKILAVKNIISSDSSTLASLGSFQKNFFAEFKVLLNNMTALEPITLSNLPETLVERYQKKGRDKLLVTVYPKSNVWDEKSLRTFTDATAKIESNITGTPIINLLFIDLMGVKGKQAILFGFIAIILILLVDFKSLVFTLLAVVPLAIGALWVAGGMVIFGMTWNYSNFMALPLILGIGIDDGVHILHRYKKEGRGKMPVVMRFTGKAILLTSITTGVGFGSMGFASHRGIASMGQVLCIGVVSCFVTSVFILPAILRMFEKIFAKKGEKSV